MRIGIFTDTYTPQVNGVVTVIRNLKEGLKKKGHDVFIFTVEHPDAKEEDGVYRINSMKFINEPQHRIGFFSRGEMIRVARAYNLDIIHSHTEFSLYLAARAVARKLGLPSVHTLHCYYEDYLYYVPVLEPFLKWQLPNVLKNIYKPQKCMVAPSKKIADYLVKCKVDRPIKVIPNGIDLSTFHSKSATVDADTKAFRERIHASPEDKLIVFVGRLGEEKNVPTLLRNFKEIQARVPDARLLVVGDGPDRRDIEAYAYELGLSGKVIFTGYLRWPDEIKTAYDASALFMSASHSEVHPITFIEAMASSLPIVAAADGSIDGMVINGDNGWAVEDDSRLWEKAVEVLSDGKLAKKMGQRSWELSDNYSVERFADSMIELYEQYRK